MIDWNHIESVFLDLDGTLLDLRFDNHFWVEFIPEHYAQHHQLAPEKARAEVLARMKQLRGTLDWYCTDFWSRELKLDIIALKAAKRHLIQTRPGAEDFLTALQGGQRRVVLVTNAHPETIELKMDQTGIASLFDRIISSHDLGYPKEHDRFWRLLHKTEPFVPEKTLLIDDNLDVLRGAAAHGISHLLAIPCPDSTREAMDTEEFRGLGAFDDILGFFRDTREANTP
ncbi:MAG: GMP/IMP nucleotidase [Arenicellales bacterium]|nr:GMP/IMP nucleotidase [Arenicellales bacterium]